jgi:hypothetical protein
MLPCDPRASDIRKRRRTALGTVVTVAGSGVGAQVNENGYHLNGAPKL